jgi:deoxycytidine triphosphate deaminase
MAFSKKGLEELSLQGKFYKKEEEDEIYEPKVYEEILVSGLPSIQKAMPDVRVAYRPPRHFIHVMRKLLSRREPSRKGLMPPLSRKSSQAALPTLDYEHYHFSEGKKTYIYLEPRPEENQVGMAGFDIRVGKLICWSDTLMNWNDKPFVNDVEIYNAFTKNGIRNYKHLSDGEEFILEHDSDGGRIYYIFSYEGVLISDNLEMFVDSKSTTGRVGCMSHAGGFSEEGKLITIVQPYAFNLMVRAGKTKLSQAIVRYKNSEYMENGEVAESKEVNLIGDEINLKDSLTSKGLIMKFDPRKTYKAKKCDEPIDMDSRGITDPTLYYDLIESKSEIECDKKTLYLPGSLGILETGATCGVLSREEEVMTGTGAWSHFAGIFQPFFRGGITMEVYSHVKMRLKLGDKAGYVRFDKIVGDIDRPKDYGGDYQGQVAPRLPKMFKE